MGNVHVAEEQPISMSHYHLTFLDDMLGKRGRRSPAAGSLVEQCIGLITAQHQNALERGCMAKASLLAPDRDIFLIHRQLVGNMKLVHQVKPLKNMKTWDPIDSGVLLQ